MNNNQSSKKSPTDTGSYAKEPPISRKDVPTIILVIKSILLILAVAISGLLVSFVFFDIQYDFVETVNPQNSDKALRLAPTIGIEEPEEQPPIPKILYDYTQAVPESEMITRDYFNDTVFIGDSRTAGLILYTSMSPIDYSAVGLNVRTILTKAFIRRPDSNGELKSYTLIDALEEDSGEFKSIYISMGINELGWEANGFIDAYRKAIDAIRAVTDVPIYIQLIMPVTVEHSKTSEFGITNEKAVVFNQKLTALAAEMELFLLDPRGLYALEDGTLDPATTYDGVHLNPKRYEAVADYYASHIVNLEAYDDLKERYLTPSDEDTAGEDSGEVATDEADTSETDTSKTVANEAATDENSTADDIEQASNE